MNQSAGVARPLDAADLVDTAREADGLRIRASKVVRADDPYLPGHFPSGAIYPGVFVIETVLQSARAALRAPHLRITAVRQARFTAPLTDGDELVIDATLRRQPADGRIGVDARCHSGDGTPTGTVRLELEPGDDGDGCARGWADAFAGLPHAHPMILVDRVVSCDGLEIEAVKAVTASEPCYADVAPRAPRSSWRYPASLLIESFGQAAALLWLAARGTPQDRLTMFATARDVQMSGNVWPGDTLRHTARLEHASDQSALVTGETRVGDDVVATFGSLLAVVRPVSLVIDRPKVTIERDG